MVVPSWIHLLHEYTTLPVQVLARYRTVGRYRPVGSTHSRGFMKRRLHSYGKLTNYAVIFYDRPGRWARTSHANARPHASTLWAVKKTLCIIFNLSTTDSHPSSFILFWSDQKIIHTPDNNPRCTLALLVLSPPWPALAEAPWLVLYLWVDQTHFSSFLSIHVPKQTDWFTNRIWNIFYN